GSRWGLLVGLGNLRLPSILARSLESRIYNLHLSRNVMGVIELWTIATQTKVEMWKTLRVYAQSNDLRPQAQQPVATTHKKE
ncbi:hypothetical protein, partial [Acidithrix ferrooxidans]